MGQPNLDARLVSAYQHDFPHNDFQAGQSVIFEDDGSVESNSRKNRVTVKGTWSYDGNSKEYAVTLGGMTAIYIVVQPKNSAACLFIKGKLEAADLRESWVSADSD
jgi:hypothetical protein